MGQCVIETTDETRDWNCTRGRGTGPRSGSEVNRTTEETRQRTSVGLMGSLPWTRGCRRGSGGPSTYEGVVKTWRIR